MQARGIRSLVVVAAVAAGATPAFAGTLAVSDFTAGADGWVVGDFSGTGGTAAPSWLAAGGNPGGFIRTGDLFGWNSYWAPGKFLGDKSAAFGAGSISLDMRIVSDDGVQYPMIVMSDGITELQYWTSPPGHGVWTPFDIPLFAAAGWELAPVIGVHGAAATDAQLLTVLSGLTSLRVDADWQTGGDQIDLDNFRILDGRAEAVPLPRSALLGLVTLGGISFVRRRRRSRA